MNARVLSLHCLNAGTDERKDMQKELKRAKDEEGDVEYWDKRQLVKKINLNSLYGAILNPGCRFFDHRIGQSTTLTGRCISPSEWLKLLTDYLQAKKIM